VYINRSAAHIMANRKGKKKIAQLERDIRAGGIPQTAAAL